MDCVVSMVTNILQGFGRAEGTLALKGAFNAVLPGVLIRQLIRMGAPRMIVNLVNCLTTKRMLYFSPSDDSSSLCGAGILSTFLFNIHLRKLNEILPADVRAAMYADDLFLYSRHSDPRRALVQLEWAVRLLTPWLREVWIIYLDHQMSAVPHYQGLLQFFGWRDGV